MRNYQRDWQQYNSNPIQQYFRVLDTFKRQKKEKENKKIKQTPPLSLYMKQLVGDITRMKDKVEEIQAFNDYCRKQKQSNKKKKKNLAKIKRIERSQTEYEDVNVLKERIQYCQDEIEKIKKQNQSLKHNLRERQSSLHHKPSIDMINKYQMQKSGNRRQRIQSTQRPQTSHYSYTDDQQFNRNRNKEKRYQQSEAHAYEDRYHKNWKLQQQRHTVKKQANPIQKYYFPKPKIKQNQQLQNLSELSRQFQQLMQLQGDQKNPEQKMKIRRKLMEVSVKIKQIENQKNN